MFGLFKNKAPALGSRALVSADPEVDGLRAEVGKLQTQAAELEADLMESRESPAAFQREFEARLGPGIRRVAELQGAVMAQLEREFDELANSPALQMPLNAGMAKRAGRDLIGEAARDLDAQARELERELKGLGGARQPGPLTFHARSPRLNNNSKT